MLKELVEHDIKFRNKLVEDGQIKATPSDFVRYCSFFSFDESLRSWVKLHNTVAGFEGLHYLQAMWVDIDNKKEPEKSHQQCIDFIKKLNTDYNVSPDDLFIYFSGKKGFHVAIHGRLFGEFQPSTDLPEKIKCLAAKITKGIDCVDFSIYEGRRVFRIVNSKHGETGLYKIEITYDELTTLTFEQIKDLAKNPRTDLKRVKSVNSLFKNDKLKKEWENCQTETLEGVKAKLYSNDGKNFFAPPDDGNRNNKLFVQAAMLFDESTLSRNAVQDICRAINLISEFPVTEEELTVIIDSAFKKTKNNGKEKKKQDLVLKSFDGWVDEYIDHVYHPSSALTTGIESFDIAMRKRVKGKLGCVVGYGGSKKSLLALNAGLRNIQDKNSHVIYSTMEMSVPQLMNRIVDYIVDGEVTNASYEMESKSRDWAHTFLKDSVSPMLGNKLYLSQNSSLVCSDYDKLIERTINETGYCDMLIVDGLSMMGGSDKEVERYSNNTKELKELANKWNIFVLLICHVAKGADKHTRDLTDKVRGSEKIFDNCDFMMTMSRIINLAKTSSEITEYFEDKGYIRFYDKRGSGITINKIFDFNPKKLTITESMENPRNYEIENTKSTKAIASF